MQNVVLIVHLLLALSLIGVVLVQRSEGGGLGIGGGDGNPQAGRPPLTAMAKLTWGAGRQLHRNFAVFDGSGSAAIGQHVGSGPFGRSRPGRSTGNARVARRRQPAAAQPDRRLACTATGRVKAARLRARAFSGKA